MVKLPWHGHETIESIPSLLDRAEQIEITLPANYNHALFRILHPDQEHARLEVIDASGGPELLAKIATVSGLEGLVALTGALTAAQAKVRVASPPTIVITLPAANLRP
ncbi:MAG: hypothetical protein L0H63_11925 [Nitrococcus sp.]|nr:hypothetical protein [Nitrococcus sp.]